MVESLYGGIRNKLQLGLGLKEKLKEKLREKLKEKLKEKVKVKSSKLKEKPLIRAFFDTSPAVLQESNILTTPIFFLLTFCFSVVFYGQQPFLAC